MNKSVHIFSIDGIAIKLHYSWFIIFILLWYSLSAEFFPHFFQGLSAISYANMGLIAAILLFLSVLAHELMHSVVAKSMNIDVKTITLFFFGGIANISTEKLKPKTEFWIAISGPILSIYLGILFLFISMIVKNNSFLFPITFYIYQINFILGIFNLIPGYPLDGGRVLRSILHKITGNLLKATYIAAKAGKFFAGLMIFIGLLGFFAGVNLFWFIILGVFLYYVAGMSYENTLIMDVLQGVSLNKIISKANTIKSSEKVIKLIENNYVKGKEIFIVTKNNKYAGILNVNDLSKQPKKTWNSITADKLKINVKTINSKQDSLKAFKLISENKVNAIAVVDKGKIKGIINMNSIIKYINGKINYGIN